VFEASAIMGKAVQGFIWHKGIGKKEYQVTGRVPVRVAGRAG
jgi:hypothetical protein